MKIAWNTSEAQALVITDRKEMEKQHPQLILKSAFLKPGSQIRSCRLMDFENVLSGTFSIPEKNNPIMRHKSFGFILSENTLYFIGNTPDVEAMIQKFNSEYDVEVRTPFAYLLRFLNFLIEEDLYYLETYTNRLEDIEENLYKGQSSGMERFIMSARKDMNILSNYYLQLSAMGESFEEDIIPQNNSDEMALVSLFLSRTSQLLSLVSEIKDYTSQIWNLRQTQLSDRQNKVSTLLTIITTIFLPLTLITGWYGMNFIDMPLIRNPRGSWITLCVCILIVCLELWFIHSRHWLTFKSGKPKDRKKQ